MESRDEALLERAEEWLDRLERPDEALAVLDRLASGEGPTARRAEALARELLERLGRFAELRERLEAGLVGGKPDEEVSRRLRLARLCNRRLADPAAAASHLEAALRLRPGRPELWQELGALYEAREQPLDLLRTLEGELATRPASDRVLEILVRAAQLCTGPLDDPDRARRFYLRALDLDPAHAEAAAFLVRSLDAEGRRGAALGILERRLHALDTRPERAPEEERVALRVEIARLRAELGDADAATAVLEAALPELGALPPALAEPLARLYAQTARNEDLAALSRRAADACAEPAERAEWNLRRARALHASGRDDEEAEALRAVLVDRPDAAEANRALLGLYRERHEWQPLAHLIEAQLGVLSGPAEIPLRRELAGLLEGPLERPDAALVQLRRILELEPGCGETLDRALALCARLGSRGEALGLLDGVLGATLPGPRRARLLVARARALREAGAEPRQAAEALGEALRLDPGLESARTLREELALELGEWEPALERLWAELLGAEGEQRVVLGGRVAELAWSKLPAEQAWPWLERVRGERPGDARLLARIAETHRRAGRFAAQAWALEAQAAATPDTREQRMLLLECARLLEQQLQAPARALALLREALAADPGDPLVLRELARVCGRANRPRARAEALTALLGSASLEERVPLLAELAGLHSDALGEPERAADCLTEALELARRTRLPLLELLQARTEALHAAAGPTSDWAHAAEEELDALGPHGSVVAERRLFLHAGLAAAYETRLGRPGAALAHWRAIVETLDTEAEEGPALAADPTRARLLERAETALLERLRAEQSHHELASRLTRRLARRPDWPEGWLELAALHGDKLHRLGEAARACSEALGLRPGWRPALRGLRAACERLGRWKTVAWTLEEELATAGDAAPAARAALLRRLGEVAWQRLQSTTRATRAYAAALEIEPRDVDSLRALEALLESIEDWEGALATYRRELTALGPGERERRRELWLRIARLATERTGDPEHALRALEAAAELGRLPVEQLRSLADLYAERGDTPRFVRALGSYLEDPAARPAGADHLALARALEQLGRHSEALEQAERALALEPACASGWETLARVRAALGDAEGAARALDRADDDRADRSAADRLVGAAADAEATRPAEAAELLRRAVAHDPACAQAYAALARLTGSLGHDDEALAAARRALELDAGRLALDAVLRLETALGAARLARQHGDLEQARRFSQAAIETAPRDAEALALHGEVLFEQGDHTGARAPLEARLECGLDDPRRPLHLAMLGRVLESGGERATALALYREALAGDAGLELAHAGATRLLERAGDLAAVAEAFDCWARSCTLPARRSELWTRAAGCAAASGDTGRAGPLLEEAHAADATNAEAAYQLAVLRAGRGEIEQALGTAERTRAASCEPQEQARMSRLRAEILEAEGRLAEAAAEYGRAVREDPRAAAMALARARVLRSLGAWREAAHTLESFAARPDVADRSLALCELGRLLAGPLGELERAIDAYQRALAIAPGLVEAQSALADLLTRCPSRWPEAVARHAAVLAREPTRLASLRALVRIARGQQRTRAVETGLAVLRALGVATPEERTQAPARLPLRIACQDGLSNGLGERLRRAVQAVAPDLAEALHASASATPVTAEHPVAAFRAAALEALGRLAAPALVPLSVEQTRSVLRLMTGLAFGPESIAGDGELLNALAGSLGRRARRQVRRILTPADRAALECFDAERWRSELRKLAAAEALDALGGDLRAALRALVEDGLTGTPADLPDESDLLPYVRACPSARALLARVVLAWRREFEEPGETGP